MIPQWELPLKYLNLSSVEVHLWRISVVELKHATDGLVELLAEDEKKRAHRFHFRKDFDRFVIARGMLRKISGQYLASAPEALQFDYNQHGKPALKPE
ncbi:phosphopantetheine-protein transferase, partial [candidate division KSB1 bacterium]|nr:phosphopantetheine-protein transferase [candidate division KSB1 bacterium]